MALEKVSMMAGFRNFGLLCALVIGMGAAGWGQANGETTARNEILQGQSAGSQTSQNQAGQNQDQDKDKGDGLLIEPTELPGTYPQGPYMVRFTARGNYVPVLRWNVEKGTLPPGIKLSEDGVLRGEAERAGEFQFTIAARDGGQPQQAVQREYVIKVVEAITLAWKVPAHVTGNRIDGSVEVSNTTADDMDLTFDVKAVAENGRATEIGYQHFPLTKGTVGMALPFGDTLPHGAYVIYVDVAGEIAKRNAIYKEEMKTPAPLQVVVGP
jgi:hypothetical protein